MKSKIQTTLEKEPHKKLVDLANDEGRNLSKMLDIVCDFYKKHQVVKELVEN